MYAFMGNLFQELKRLKVFKVRATYAIVGWVLALIAAFVVDAFAAPPMGAPTPISSILKL